MKEQVIAVYNLKGGVAKTTTAVNLASVLSERGRKVLLIDLDPQGHCARATGIDPSSLKRTSLDLFLRTYQPEEIIQATSFKNLSIIPSNFLLATIEIALKDRNIPTSFSDLKDRIARVKQAYDYIIIDCPPSLSYLTSNALCAADWVLLPVQCDYFCFSDITNTLATINRLKRAESSPVKILGLLETMMDENLRMSAEISAQLNSSFGEGVFPMPIPRSVSLVECQSHGVPINYYRPNSKGAIAYARLAREVEDRIDRALKSSNK